MPLRRLTRVYPGCVGIRIPPHVHPYRTTNRKADGNHLRAGKSPEYETVVLGAEELDDEALDTGQHAVQSEQPTFGVLVISEAPQNQEHYEAERDFVELSRVDGEDLIRRRT